MRHRHALLSLLLLVTLSPAGAERQVAYSSPTLSSAVGRAVERLPVRGDLLATLFRPRELEQFDRAATLERTRRLAASIKHDLYPDPQPQPAPVRVVARRYYDNYKQRYVDVESVRIEEKGVFGRGARTTAWNQGRWITFEAVHREGQVGKYYNVLVTWEDGSTRNWDYRLDSPRGLTVDVWKPL